MNIKTSINNLVFIDILSGKTVKVENPVAKLLIVEGNHFKRSYLHAFFASLNYQVDTAKDGVACIEMVGEDIAKYHAVLINVTIPKIDGFATAKSLREVVRYEKPIIGFSVICDQDIKKRAKAAGMDQCIDYFEGNTLLKEALECALNKS